MANFVRAKIVGGSSNIGEHVWVDTESKAKYMHNGHLTWSYKVYDMFGACKRPEDVRSRHYWARIMAENLLLEKKEKTDPSVENTKSLMEYVIANHADEEIFAVVDGDGMWISEATNGYTNFKKAKEDALAASENSELNDIEIVVGLSKIKVERVLKPFK